VNKIAAALIGVLPVAVGGARVRARPVSPPSAPAFAAALAAPSPGDVSYGLAQVRIAGRPRRPADPAAATGDLMYAGRVGGLAVTVRARDWRALRASTRVYVVVSRVAGQGPAVRDVAWFVVRRHTGGIGRLAPPGAFVLSVADATPAQGSFWVRGIDRRGLARIFAVRNMLETAVANWGRYLRVLRAADALAAAARPLELGSSVHGPRARPRGGAPTVWVGGQRPTRRERAILRLLMNALGNPLEYAAVKRNPLIAEFITHDLDNPILARRWQRVTTRLPLRVPDRYAAAAQEEAQFTSVAEPRISRAAVEMADGTNSSSQMGAEDPAFWTGLAVRTSGTGQGTVEGREYVTGPNIDCGPQCGATFLSGATSETLTETAANGSAFAGWSGCDQILASGACRLEVGRVNRTVTASFNLANSIQVILVGPGRPRAHPKRSVRPELRRHGVPVHRCSSPGSR
jgi:hypothetical protein